MNVLPQSYSPLPISAVSHNMRKVPYFVAISDLAKAGRPVPSDAHHIFLPQLQETSTPLALHPFLAGIENRST